MADLRRLGKRGSYRLGSSRDQVGPWPWLAVVLAGTLVIAGAAELGLWFVPFLAGLAVGLLLARPGWRLRHTLPAVLVMALLGWGVPLYWPAVVQGQPAGATARVIAALAGVPPHAVFGVVFTLLVAVLQAVVGLWLGRALTPRAQSS
ncbi:MAG TPA: hypothetical protein VGJ19_01630 [Streptosporangiaceae bacterium]|jgi:hypothetical protein